MYSYLFVVICFAYLQMLYNIPIVVFGEMNNRLDIM